MKVLVSRSPGQVTYRKRFHLLAPSSSAASYRSAGMVCRPESQMTMWKPTACQIDRKMMAGIAELVLLSQSVPWMVLKDTACRTWLTRPSGWYMNRQRIDTTTIDVTTGMKYNVRKKFDPRVR